MCLGAVSGVEVGVGANAYRYNGKELLEDVGLYDYGARYYDPAIARWGQVDPLAENHSPYSSYNYVLNNPTLLIDPDGRDTSFADQSARDLFQSTYAMIQGRITEIDENDKWSDRKKDRKKARYLADREVLDNLIASDQMFRFETALLHEDFG